MNGRHHFKFRRTSSRNCARCLLYLFSMCASTSLVGARMLYIYSERTARKSGDGKSTFLVPPVLSFPKKKVPMHPPDTSTPLIRGLAWP